ncbi:hypothetical protein F4775DRAFT_563215 [Biscogniauxia sp. FL1348]|nr:hypothetical protein F4775DRAFT_563215 [Biscogniauxia sp. FL1348]
MPSNNSASSATMNKPHDNPPAAGSPPGPRRTTKIILGTISVAIAAALLALGILGFSAPIGFRILGGLATALSISVLLYHVLESALALALYSTRSRSPCTPLPPAWALSLNLVLGLGGVVVAALLIASTAYVVHWEGSFDDDDEGSSSTPVPVPGYVANGYHWFRLSVAACALAVAEAIIHIVLAALAAVDVHRLRRSVGAGNSSSDTAYGEEEHEEAHEEAHELESSRGGACSPEPKSRGS